jgi:outer membrane protein assembly factor BamB
VRRAAGWLPVLLLVPGAVVAGVAVSVPEDELAAMRDQQPLDAGTTWVYDVFDHGEPSGTRTSQVVGTASLIGRGDTLSLLPVAEVRRTYTDYPGSGPRTFTSYFAVEGRTMVQYAQEEGGTWYDIEPAVPAYRLPNEVGQRWSYDGAVGGTALSFETELVAIEDVEVSGRTFEDCTHAVTTAALDLEDSPGAEEVVDEWTCPGYGTVKLRDRIEATGQDFTEELTEFHGVEADWVSGDATPVDAATDADADAGDVAGSTEGFDRTRSYAVPDGVLGRTPAWTDIRTERGLLAPVSDGEVMVLAERNGAVSLRTTGTGEMRWRLQLRGPILAAPVLAGGVVVVADSLKRVWALSVADGTARWAHELPDVASASPIAVADLVVVPSDDGTVTALGLADGKVRWSSGLDAAARTAPAYDGTHLLVGDLSGTITALDPVDGSVGWSDALDSGVAQGPVVTDDGTLVQDGDGVVHAYDDGGSVVWQSRGRGQGSEPMAAHDGVLVSVDDGETVTAYDTDNGRRLWRRTMSGLDSPPVVVGEEVLLVTRQGEVQVLGLADGRRVDRWTLPPPAEGGEFYNDVSAALVDDTVVVTAGLDADLATTVLFAYPVTPDAQPGLVPRLEHRAVPGVAVEPPLLVGDDLVMPVLDELVKVGPDGATDRLLRSPDGLQTGAAVSDGIVVARSNDQLQARRLADGELVWKVPAGPANYGSTPVIHRSTVFYGVEGVGLSAVDVRTGAPRWTTPIPAQVSVPSPVVLPDGDVVYGGGGLARYDGATGRQEWQDPVLHMVAPAAYADGIVLAAGISPTGPPVFTAVDASTGQRVWEHEMSDPPYYLAPAVEDGVVVSVDGRVVHAYDVRSGDELWSVATSGAAGGAPVVADGHVFLTEAGIGRDQDDQAFRISVHDLRTGRFLTAWEPGSMSVSPAPNVGGAPGGRLLVPTTTNLVVLELP